MHSLEGADPGTGQGMEMPPCVGAPSSPLLFAWHAEESQQGGTGQNNVRAWKEGTHLLEGADPGLVKAWKCRQVCAAKCWCALVHPRVRCCLLHGMQKNPSREGLVRTMSGNERRVHTCWKGQTPGLVRTWKDTQ